MIRYLFALFSLAAAQIYSPAGALDDAVFVGSINDVSNFFLIKSSLLAQGGDSATFLSQKPKKRSPVSASSTNRLKPFWKEFDDRLKHFILYILKSNRHYIIRHFQLFGWEVQAFFSLQASVFELRLIASIR